MSVDIGPVGSSGPRPPRAVLPHALAMGFDLDRYLDWRRRRDGDPFRVRFPGFGGAVFTGTAAGAREFFRAPPELLRPPLPNPIEPMVGPASLILARGERHRRERALLAPAMHRTRISAYATVIRDATRAEIDGERTGTPWRPGGRIDARAAARAMTLRVILAAVFGIEDRERLAEFTAATTAFLESFGTSLFLVPVLRRRAFGLTGWERFEAARERLDALIDTEVRRRRASGDKRDDTDLLGLMLESRYEDGSAIDDTELREQLRTLLVAGHETTATALVWALFRLHRTPATLARLRTETAGAGSDLEPSEVVELPYLDAVCKETLRLHPPVPIVLRRLTGDFALRGVALTAGDTMGLSLRLLHTDPAVFPDPLRFHPDRFVEHRYSPFEYAPFGGGHRRCIGSALADYELRIVLATIVDTVRMRLSPRFAAGPPPRTVPHTIAVGPRAALTFEID